MTQAPAPNAYRDTWCGTVGTADEGREVRVSGWVHFRRDHGGLIFIDLRDRTGLLQLVFHPDSSGDAFAAAERLRSEHVVSVRGKVVLREPQNVNPNMATGEIELAVESMDVLAEADTPPFPVNDDTPVDENTRLTHRMIDLRREHMRDALVLRHEIVRTMRDTLYGEDFLEVETPILTRSTPEGARDFLVPVAPATGVLVRAAAVAPAVQAAADDERLRALLPDRPLLPRRGPARRPPARVHAARPRDGLRHRGRGHRGHGTRHDRGVRHRRSCRSACSVAPDGLRRGRAQVRDRPARHPVRHGDPRRRPVAEGLRASRSSRGSSPAAAWSARSTPVSARCRAASSTASTTSSSATARLRPPRSTSAVMPAGSGTSRSSSPASRSTPSTRSSRRPTATSCCSSRTRRRSPPPPWARCDWSSRSASASCEPGTHDVLWVVDFPMFEHDPENDRYDALHHPFTAPSGDLDDPASLRSRAYDLVLDGTEIGGGSIRIHTPEVQAKVFEHLGLDADEAQGAVRVPARRAALRRAAARRHRDGDRPHRRAGRRPRLDP